MKNKICFVKQVSSLLFVFIVAIISSTMLQAKESVEDGLQRCALTNNSSARLACYDLLSGRDSELTPKIVETPALPAKKVDAKPKPLILASEPKVASENEILKITKCIRAGGNDKYTFYLDDGQVWKQVSHKRMNFEDCNLEVSIHKDFFGYKMQVEGETKKFRVSRVR